MNSALKILSTLSRTSFLTLPKLKILEMISNAKLSGNGKRTSIDGKSGFKENMTEVWLIEMKNPVVIFLIQ